MNFDIKINNLGRVRQANIKLAPFTVIAGANSSGKSFVTRALYSFFSTINKDHVTNDTILSASQAYAVFHSAISNVSAPSHKAVTMWDSLCSLFNDLRKSIQEELGAHTFLEQQARAILLDEKIDKIDIELKYFLSEIDGKKKYSQCLSRTELAHDFLRRLRTSLKNPTRILSNKIENGFMEALKENFQVPSLTDLKSFSASESDHISFDFGSLGSIKVKNEDIEFELTPEGIDEFQSLYNVVFIESPIYWKLRKPLTKINEYPGINLFSRSRLHRGKSDTLTGVPKYFYDLINLVEKDLKSTSKNPKINNFKQKLDDIIGGELDISDSGDIFFNDKGSSKSININITASGVTNLGLIGLLLKRNVIAEGSFIFVDEPEVNLHPAWQKVMIEILYELSQCGINVVVASHSLDMMKYIENIMEKHPIEKLPNTFAINRLSSEGVSLESDSEVQTLAKIKEDLGRPFYDMMLDSGW